MGHLVLRTLGVKTLMRQLNPMESEERFGEFIGF